MAEGTERLTELEPDCVEDVFSRGKTSPTRARNPTGENLFSPRVSKSGRTKSLRMTIVTLGDEDSDGGAVRDNIPAS